MRMENFKGNNLSVFSGDFIFLLLVFIINPFVAVSFSLLLALKSNQNQFFHTIKLLMIFISFFLGLLNITKIPASDQIQYSQLYMNMANMDVLDVVKGGVDGSGKEIIYALFTYFSYQLLGPSLQLFFFLITLVVYGLHFAALYNIYKIIGVKNKYFICAILVFAFYLQFFNVTIHLIRQVLAISILVFALSYKIRYNKHLWVLYLIAFLTHSVMGLMIFIVLCPYFYNKMTYRKAFSILALMIIFILSFTIFGEILVSIGIFDNIESVDYVLQRMSTIQNSTEYGTSITYVLIVNLPLFFISLRILYLYNPFSSKSDFYKIRNLFPVIYIYICLFFFIIGVSNISLFMHRLLFMTYSFIPFILPFAFKDTRINNLYLFSVSLFFMGMFLFTYNHGQWEYVSLDHLLLFPVPYYVLNPFY